MTYEYLCEKCGVVQDIIKSVSEIDRKEACPSCDNPMSRQISHQVYFIGASVESAEYNPGLGCVTKNKKHREEIAKRKGMVEVGSDFGSSEKLQTHFDNQREEKRRKAYDDI